jgi:hypothetical protein
MSCELYAFNRLPRPALLFDHHTNLDTLEQAFPFLFKPNRVLALHPHGHPSKESEYRWLIRLKSNSLQQLFPDLPICFFTLTYYGKFSLWYFQQDPKTSGSYPLFLYDPDHEESNQRNNKIIVQNHLYLFKLPNAAQSPHTRLHLLSVIQSTDEDGFHFIRLGTPQGNYTISLDLVNFKSPISFHAYVQTNKENFHSSPHEYYQIGGWNEGCETFYWNDADKKLLMGNPRLSKKIQENEYDFRINAAAQHDDLMIIGGEHKRVYFYEKNALLFYKESIKGYVSTLDIIPADKTPTKTPYILVGSDDNTLYILDKNGQVLQKAVMQGRIYNLLYLNSEEEKWADIALIISGYGLYTTRLFFDCLELKGQQNIHKEEYKNLLRKKYLNTSTYETLKNWFLYKEHSYRQLMAVVMLLDKPTQEYIALFKDQDVLSAIHDNFADFLLHSIKRKIKYYLKNPNPEELRLMIQLLGYLAKGTCCARMGVRSLEGYLVSQLKEKMSQEVIPVLDNLLNNLPDAKRNLYKIAKEISEHRHIEEKRKIELFLSTCERIRFDRLFNELIINPHNSELGTIRALCFAGKKEKLGWSQVHLYSNACQLYAFKNNCSPEKVSPEENKRWLINFGETLSINTNIKYKTWLLRSLARLDEMSLVLISDNCLGLAIENNQQVKWEYISNLPLRAIAIKQETFPLVVVGGEWYKYDKNNKLLQVFQYKNGQLVEHPLSFQPPTEINYLSIRDLSWDEKNCLWAATWENGRLLRWVDFLQPPEIFKTLNTALYTLSTWHDLIVCGGKDGVVRAFNQQGELAWVFITNGIIRSIQTLHREPFLQAEHLPVFAVISEAEHLWTLDAQGQQCGMIYMEHLHPVALSSWQLYNTSAIHHLVGTVEGQVRLIEEVTLEEKEGFCVDYLYFIENSAENTSKNSMEILKELCHNLATNISELQRYCQTDKIIQEPLLAAWAVRQLLKHHQDYQGVINSLIAIKDKDGSSIRRFRAQAFSVLGKQLPRIPEHHRKEIYALCENAKDGAIAALLLAIPQENLITDELLNVILNKVKTRKPFTSSALLQLLSRQGFQTTLEKVLIYVLENPQNQDDITYHAGFIEGLLMNLFRLLNVKESLILAFINISISYPKFSDNLRTNEIRREFFFQLMRYSNILFETKIDKTLNLLNTHFKLQELKHENIEFFDENKFQKEVNELENIPDSYLLTAILQSFPISSYFSNTYSKDISQKISQLFPLVQELKELQENIQFNRYAAPKIKRVLEDYKRRLEDFKCHFPLFCRLQEMWKQRWLTELETLRTNSWKEKPLHWLQPVAEVVRFVKGEPAPLVIKLRNDGPEDIDVSVRFYFDSSALPYLECKQSQQVSAKHLYCARESQAAQEIVLKNRLLPPFEHQLTLKICWQINEEIETKEISIVLVPRWTTYRSDYPLRDDLIMRLLTKKAKKDFVYQRVIIRCWRDYEPNFSAKELSELAREWAARSGRDHDLRLMTPEISWSQAQRFPKDEWLNRLQTSPEGLEIWFIMGSTIPWSLAFLEALDQAPHTALFLPQLVFEDLARTQHKQLYQLLDILLSPQDRNQLAVLQWGLKACVQGVCEVSTLRTKSLPPVMLACEIFYGKERILRGDCPSLHAWKEFQGNWLIAGIPQDNYHAFLAPDAVKPLLKLVPQYIFHSLYRMGLIKDWGDFWLPRSIFTIEYIDNLYPTRVISISKTSTQQLTWRWQTEQWQETKLIKAKQALFGQISFEPFEGFDFNDWQRLRDYTRKDSLTKDFYPLLGLADHDEYQKIQDSQQQWYQLMNGGKDYSLLTKKLTSAYIEIYHVDNQDNYRFIYLRLPNEGQHFNHLLLLLPTTKQFIYLSSEKNEATLIEKLAQSLNDIEINLLHNDWKTSIKLMLYELPVHLQHHSLLNMYDTVFLTGRDLNRLLSTHRSIRDTLIEIILKRLSLKELAERVFTIAGPVNHTQFFGRVKTLRHLIEGLLNDKSFVITGPRGIGKSSLLRFIRYSESWTRLKTKFVPLFLDLQDQRGSESYGRFLNNLIKNNNISISQHLKDELDELVAKEETDYIVDETLRSHVVRLTNALLDEIEIHTAPCRPLFLFDEVDAFYLYDQKHKESLFTLFRAAHNQKSMQFVFSSYPPQAESMSQAITDPRNQIYNFVEPIVLGTLEIDEGVELIQHSMSKLGIKITQLQARQIAEQTFAIPNLLQKACLEICTELQKQIDKEDNYNINETIIKHAFNTANDWYLEIFMSQLKTSELRQTLIGLVLEDNHQFNLEQAVNAFKRHANVDWSPHKVKVILSELLYTLILELKHGLYHFAGTEKRPYFPTLVLNSSHGKEELELRTLQEMDYDKTQL